MKGFEDDLGFLSNFTHVPHGIHGYPTVEHFFVAMKTTDQSIRDQIKEEISPGRVKRIGRKLELRPDWDEIKLKVMEYALRIKFKPGTGLAEMLVATGDRCLVEYNKWHDNYWGDCYCNVSKCQWPGGNHLGKLLMKIRSELVSEDPS